eukprot:SAG22_NODE_22044_length_252_cov_0.607843_1_plen_84_part_11
MVWSPHLGPPPPPPPPAPPPSPHYPHGGSPGRIGEGGPAYSLGDSNHVIMLHYNNIFYSSQGGQNFSWYTNSALVPKQVSVLPA